MVRCKTIVTCIPVFCSGKARKRAHLPPETGTLVPGGDQTCASAGANLRPAGQPEEPPRDKRLRPKHTFII